MIPRVTIETLAQFLVGSSTAIRQFAACRGTIWLGLVLVMSAAFAREYDGDDLVHEPWHLLLPLAASAATSFVLFVLVELVVWRGDLQCSQFFHRYRSFLGLYWMTAPLAWVYAIPVERFLSEGKATEANLWILGTVSLWRVLLITRVLSVMYVPRTSDVKITGFFFVVMLFADSLAIFLMSFVDVQILVLMGGVRLSEAEQVMASAKLIVSLLGYLTWPIWLIGTLTVMLRRSVQWWWTGDSVHYRPRIAASLKLLGAGSVFVWFIVLPWTQPEQQLRHAVERHLNSSDYRQAFATMSEHRRDEFPPHWDPPPQIGSRKGRSRILDVVTALDGTEAAWVRQVYIAKLDAALGGSFPMDTIWQETNVSRILDLLDKLPEGPNLLRERRGQLEILQHYDDMSAETKLRVQETYLRLELPWPKDDSTGWPSERVKMWNDFLDSLHYREDRIVILGAYESKLRQLRETNADLPVELQERIDNLLTDRKDK